MVPREELVAWLNSIEWRKPEVVSLRAEELINEHLRLMRAVIEHLTVQKHVTPVDAHAMAQTAGHDSREGESILHDLFSKVTFRGAGVRTSLIANIAAAYCWHLDPDLRELPNPWPPLLELYGMGYTSSGDDDDDGNGLTLIIGYNGGTKTYRIV